MYGLDLDGDDRQDLHGDTVELVEAAPRAWLGQAFVDVAYRLTSSKAGWVGGGNT
jgi:hypothetical protein